MMDISLLGDSRGGKSFSPFTGKGGLDCHNWLIPIMIYFLGLGTF